MQVDFDERVADLDEAVRGFWDLVPEINSDLLHVKLSEWGDKSEKATPGLLIETPAETSMVISTKTQSGQAALPSMKAALPSMRPGRPPIRTFEQKRDEIMAVWRQDRRFADLLDHDVIAVVDDNDDDLQTPDLAIDKNDDPAFPTDFQLFAERHFLPNRGGLLSAAESPKDRASFSMSLKKPLLLGADTGLAPSSAKAFKKITTYMGNRKSSKSALRQCRELLEMALRSPEAVRDEIYALVCKQMNANPNHDSLVRGWRLLSLCTGHFPPSGALLPVLKAFIVKGIENPGVDIREIAAYALQNLRSVQRNGARTIAASNPEIAACELRRPVVIKIWHQVLGTDALRVAVESQTTARAVVQAIAVRLGITIPSAFSLSVPRHKNRRELAHYEKVLDVVSEFLLETKSEAGPDTDLAAAKNGIDAGFAFSARLFQAARLPTYSDAELDLMFARTTEDVLAGRYPADEKDYMALGILQVYATFIVTGVPFPSDGDWVAAMVHTDIVQKRSRSYLEQRLRTEAAKLTGRERREVQFEYIRYTYRWDTAGGTFYSGVRNRSDDNQPVMLCVTERGLHLVDPVTRSETRKFPYSRIKWIGDDGATLNVTSGTDHHEFRVQLETGEAGLIHDLLQDYIGILAATYTKSPIRNV